MENCCAGTSTARGVSYGFRPAGSQLPFAAPLGQGEAGCQMLDVLHESSSIEVFGDVALCYTHTHARTCALFFPRVYSQCHRGFTIAHSTLNGLLSVHWGFVRSLTSPNSEVLFRLGLSDILLCPVITVSRPFGDVLVITLLTGLGAPSSSVQPFFSTWTPASCIYKCQRHH